MGKKRQRRSEVVEYHGKKMNAYDRAVVQTAERMLGYQLTIVQGGYNAGGVSASAGTHDGGGALDLIPYDHAKKVKVFRELGCAAWHRKTLPGVWGEHIHVVIPGSPDMSPVAERQVIAYDNRRDGLAGNGPDRGPKRLPRDKIRFPPRWRISGTWYHTTRSVWSRSSPEMGGANHVRRAPAGTNMKITRTKTVGDREFGHRANGRWVQMSALEKGRIKQEDEDD
ncbi:hypothetical protein [Mumia flava]|uniref:hypothetical protein n=1 Tax=Mumia flava TaxID=1348852 RepID=UPI000C246E11|nr:hypothetical protein [Mumia flava]